MERVLLMLVISFFIANVTFAKHNGNNGHVLDSNYTEVSKTLDLWMEHFIDLTKNTAGYSAPVAARTFNYLSIGMYESVAISSEELKSLNGQLKDFSFKKRKLNLNRMNEAQLLNHVCYKLAKYFFVNMPPSYLEHTKELFIRINSETKVYTNKKSKRIIEKNADYLVREIIQWSEKDNAKDAWNNNFPKAFKTEICESCWQRTYPGFESALQPYWGQNRLSIEKNAQVFDDIPFMEFSADSTSKFYKEAELLYKDLVDLDKNQIDIARYWNDAPGVSGTPAGHLFQLGRSLLNTYQIDIFSTLKFYVTLGIGLNDAVIECWKLKYEYNLIRPITYIHRYISLDYSTCIATPPFPEFPSGHSIQAGCGSEIFSFYFLNTSSFVDSTNMDRKDINGSPRKYTSFREMAQEMSNSRYFGGIHFMNTLKVSLRYGRKIGKSTIQELDL